VINIEELNKAVYNAIRRLMAEQMTPSEARNCVKVYMTHEGYAELMHSINGPCSLEECEISQRGTIQGCEVFKAAPPFNSDNKHPLWSVVTVCPV